MTEAMARWRAPLYAARRRMLPLQLGAALLLSAAASALPVLPTTVSADSTVLLDFQKDGVAAELQLPQQQLALAMQRLHLDGAVDVNAPERGQLASYLLAHIHPVTQNGRAWQIDVRDMAVTPASDDRPVQLNVRLWMTPPPGAPVRRLHLDYDVMTHVLPAHAVRVYARNDWHSGVVADQPEWLGNLHRGDQPLLIDRDQSSFWQGVRSLMTLSAHAVVTEPARAPR